MLRGTFETYAEEGLAVDPDEVELPPYYPDTPEVRTVWAQYLSSVQVFDAKVGKVREMLEKEGLLEDTVIVVLTDHGRDLVRGKFNLYDAGIHLPLVVWIPEQYRPAGYEPGTVSDRLVSGVDISPTMLSLAGVELPPTLPGAPFLGPDAKERPYAFAHRDRVITHLDRSRAVVDKRYHYIRNYMPDQAGYFPASLYQQLDIGYDEVLAEMLRLRAEGKLNPDQEQILAETRPIEELFDIEQDPTRCNLADDPEYLPVLRRMRSALELWKAQTQDKGFLPELPEGAQKGAFLVDFGSRPPAASTTSRTTACTTSRLAGVRQTDPVGGSSGRVCRRGGRVKFGRHAVLLVLIGFGLLLCVIVLGQLLDQGDVKEWLSEQSPDGPTSRSSCWSPWTRSSRFSRARRRSAQPRLIAADGGLQLELVMLAGALGAIVGDSCSSGSRVEARPRSSLSSTRSSRTRRSRSRGTCCSPLPGSLIVAGRYVPGMRFAVNASAGSRRCRTGASFRGPFSGGRSGRSTHARWPTTSRPRWPATQPHL